MRIGGRVNTGFHGRWGDIPFGVILDKVEALRGDRERQFLKDVGVFHNSTSHTVDIWLYSRRGLVYCDIIGTPPSEYGETGIEEGSATVMLRSADKKLRDQPEKVIATCNISFGGAARRYYDSRQNVYYYDMSAGEIPLVMPTKAQRWNLLPMVDRN